MTPLTRRLSRITAGCLLGGSLVVAVLASPLGRMFDRAVSQHLDRIYARFLSTGRLDATDRVQCMLLYKTLAAGGHVVSPEGAAILTHYLAGSGTELRLSNSYIRTSPVLTAQLAGMTMGQEKRVTFKQAMDWRLSYALNPLNIRKERHRVVVSQFIVFAKDRTTHTNLNYGLGQIRIPDGLVHSLHPKPFLATCTWQY
ncbi:hypothetical protein F0P96_06265 [Hymenobacter busanensis]|uniref:Uncharacterized protein n=1 Tax=Hymenobacter busanensis TaxID=2607656 RepID=A0A7L5A4M5_9BACT|nr:hypothetical protein [Hymenobacter busanensis]KAA9338433.1 hypothetical protein F0P96_06265 [Hymenobacter busanensis]QHJ09140.1 hypothetical protein GUY19_18340 [Hymenobacter busanensis]